MSSPKPPVRVLVIGLDGATFTLLRPWLESRELPCLSRLYHEGVHGTLESVIPPLSPEAWSTFMTGKHPGQHGVMNFLSVRPGSYELEFNSGASVRAPTLWRMLGDRGLRVGVVGVPMTYPPERVNGYLVSGLETPGRHSQFTYPPELAGELRRALGGYELHGDFLPHAKPEVYLDRLLEAVDNQARAVRYLFARYPADLSAVVIGATDRAQHCFWRFWDPSHPRHDPEAPPGVAQALKRVYERVDGAVEAIVHEVPDPKVVLVVSDHGFGSCHKFVHLNRWLEARGYLVTSSGSAAGFGLARRMWQRACQYMPQWLKDWLKSVLPGVRQQVESFFLLSRMDWAKTRAFSLNSQHGYIYLHSRDRFPQGVVAPEEREALAEAIEAELQELRDPETGEPVVKQVLRVDELYPGPARERLPDLIVLWREGYIARTDSRETSTEAQRGEQVVPIAGVGDMERLISLEQSGSHTAEGILIAHGEGVAGPGEIEGARLVDLAPTMLHLLGQAVPEDMEGRVLTELLDPALLASRPVRYSARETAEEGRARPHAYTPEEAEEVEKRLRDLGYLD